MKSLSVLIPTYNTVCVALVRSLHAQLSQAGDNTCDDFRYEIIVADDGSTNQSSVAENEVINSIPDCRYLIRKENRGRSITRNFLARQARYDYLLFIDSDMVVRNDNYIHNYLTASECDVIYGGYVINGIAAELENNLRYIYECKNKRNGNAAERNKHPYNDFHTSNFLVRRSLFLTYPLDERFRKYGYEDVLWGKTLKQNGIKIYHIDNALSFEKFETNDEFISKTEEGLRTLHSFKDELKGYSNILSFAEKINNMHIGWLFRSLFGYSSRFLKQRLVNNKPSVFLFNIYKLGYFLNEI